MRCTDIGIDEAGYGPVLGPLVIMRAGASSMDPQAAAQRLIAHGVRDSKQIHRSGNLAPLESVALPAIAWLSGRHAQTVADLNALLDVDASDLSAMPWLAAASDTRLPVAATELPRWDLDGIEPIPLAGAIIHPGRLNRGIATGHNKADQELAVIARLLGDLDPTADTHAVIDRLGGRRYYSGLLMSAQPGQPPVIIDESNTCSRYRCGRLQCSFLVKGDRISPWTALASVIAKYIRELHMLLLNRYWCSRRPGLRPTAGYPQDARRWLLDLGMDRAGPYESDLIRGATWMTATAPSH